MSSDEKIADVDEPADREGDPFKCPACGSRDVTCRGDGYRDCQACPWELRPQRDVPRQTTQQTGLNNY